MSEILLIIYSVFELKAFKPKAFTTEKKHGSVIRGRQKYGPDHWRIVIDWNWTGRRICMTIMNSLTSAYRLRKKGPRQPYRLSRRLRRQKRKRKKRKKRLLKKLLDQYRLSNFLFL